MSTATERARNSGSKRMIACTEKSGMKMQANMEHQKSVSIHQTFVIPSKARDLQLAARCRSLALLGMTIHSVCRGCDYPAHAARLLKLAVDCTGFRSKRERNNSAVISN